MRLRISRSDAGSGRSNGLRLADGRNLEYAEWGDPGGVPVIHMHGLPGSRLETHAPDAVYRRLGVRLITVDRPGYGLSDPKPGRTLQDWPADLGALADHLELERFGLTALSGGGPFALAAAARLPDRLTGVALAGCLAPLDHPGALAGMRWLNRLGLLLAAHAPWSLAVAYRVLRQVLDRSPDFFLAWMTGDKPPPDRGLIEQPAIHEALEIMLQEAVRKGVLGAVQEVRLIALPWGFDLADVRVPVHLWHGVLDDTAPIAQADYLAAHLPLAELHRCPGEAHMVMWPHLVEILSAASGRALGVPGGVPAEAGLTALARAAGAA